MFRLATVTVIGIIAAGVARVPVLRNWSPWVYLVLFPILRTSRIIHSRRRERYLNGVTGDV